jgi:splicing factor 3B subunit 4
VGALHAGRPGGARLDPERPGDGGPKSACYPERAVASVGGSCCFVCLQGFAFVEMRSPLDAEYASRTLGMVSLFGRPLRVSRSSASKKRDTAGAKLYIGGLSAEVDEKVLYGAFSAFGGIASPPFVQRDPSTGAMKGCAFVEMDTFEAADRAIEALNGQFLGGRAITVQYSMKKDHPGERHGSQAERMMAAAKQASASSGPKLSPHTRFSAVPPTSAALAAAPPVIVTSTAASTVAPPAPMGYAGGMPPPPAWGGGYGVPPGGGGGY